MLLCIKRSWFCLPLHMVHYGRLLRPKCSLWLMKHQGAHSMAHNIKHWINGPEWSWIQWERKHYISKDIHHRRIASLVKIYIWKICDPLPVQQIHSKPSYIKLCTQSNYETDDWLTDLHAKSVFLTLFFWCVWLLWMYLSKIWSINLVMVV